MKPELQNQLFQKYPKIFQDRNKSPQETCMCWGLEIGDGWYWLIDMLCYQLQWDIDKNNEPQIVASQVKEKFGGLRFYTNGSTEKQEAQISLAETMSYHICFECGSTKKVSQTERGWIVTLCKDCMEKYLNDK